MIRFQEFGNVLKDFNRKWVKEIGDSLLEIDPLRLIQRSGDDREVIKWKRFLEKGYYFVEVDIWKSQPRFGHNFICDLNRDMFLFFLYEKDQRRSSFLGFRKSIGTIAFTANQSVITTLRNDCREVDTKEIWDFVIVRLEKEICSYITFFDFLGVGKEGRISLKRILRISSESHLISSSVMVYLIGLFSRLSVTINKSRLLFCFAHSWFKVHHSFSLWVRVRFSMSQSNMLSKSKSQGVGSRGVKVSIPNFDNTELIKSYDRTLIGRCMNPFRQDMNSLLFLLPRIWQVENKVAGADLGMGRFQFNFDYEEDMNAVLNNAPYHFDYWMVALVKWEPVVSSSYPSKIMFWAKVMGVPLHFWAIQTFECIGKALGKYEETDLDEGRVLVEVDGFKPLIFKVTIEFANGQDIEISVCYEKLYGFCNLCNNLCHESSRCPTREGLRDHGREERRRPDLVGLQNVSYKTMVNNGREGRPLEGSASRGVGGYANRAGNAVEEGASGMGLSSAEKAFRELRPFKGKPSRSRKVGSFHANGQGPTYVRREMNKSAGESSESQKGTVEGKLASVMAEKGLLETQGDLEISEGAPKARKSLTFEEVTPLVTAADDTTVQVVSSVEEKKKELIGKEMITEDKGFDNGETIMEKEEMEKDDLLVQEEWEQGQIEDEEEQLQHFNPMIASLSSMLANTGGLELNNEGHKGLASQGLRKQTKLLPKVFGNSSKKRVVQALVSPRKKTVSRIGGKSSGQEAGKEDKGTSNPLKSGQQPSNQD